MPSRRVHRVAPELRARITATAPPLPAWLEAEVARAWAEARAGTPGLFNGLVFSADDIAPGEICGHWTEFRRIIAQFRNPALYDTLRLRPLAVCGVVSCRDGVVFGRRPADAVYQAGMWQLPPAGSVEPDGEGGEPDLREQLFRELREELGIGPEDVTATRVLCAVEHPGTHVVDLGFAIATRLDAGALRDAHAGRGNGEYPELRIAGLTELAETIAAMGDTLVPPARVFLRQAGLLDAVSP